MKIPRRKAEYGGFLPLELNSGNEYFAKYEQYLHRFNSIKAALHFLILWLEPKKIYVPYYYCPSTIEAIRRTNIKICFYHIDKELMPVYLSDEEQSIVLLVDYFGVRSELVKKIARTFRRAEVIIDMAHGFYEEPVIAEHIHNVYSAKKFFGIPDGAYLISKTMTPVEMPLSKAHGYAEYLLTSYEEGTNAAYQMKKDADRLIATDYNWMSKLAIGLLRNVDYNRVQSQRTDNYQILLEAFIDLNELILPERCAAYHFPLLISNCGKDIKNQLIKERVYVPTLWTGIDLLKNGNAFELDMQENAIFLPVDQRYDIVDMKFIAGRVKHFLEVTNEKVTKKQEIKMDENIGYNNS